MRSFVLDVLEKARPIPTISSAKKNNAHYVNHGGVAIVSSPGGIVAKIDDKLKLTTCAVLSLNIRRCIVHTRKHLSTGIYAAIGYVIQRVYIVT